MAVAGDLSTNNPHTNLLDRLIHAFAVMIGGEEIRRFFRREKAEVGGVAFGETVLEAEERSGACGESGPSVFEENASHALGEERAAKRRKCGTGEASGAGWGWQPRRAIGANLDFDVAQGVTARFRSGARCRAGSGCHGVGGEEEARGMVALLQGAREDAKGVGREMESVGDEGREESRLGERVKDNVLEFGHRGGDGVAEMGPADGAGFDGGGQRFAHGEGVAEEELDIFPHARANDLAAGVEIDLRCEGDEFEERTGDGEPFVEKAQARLLHPFGAVRAAGAGVGIEPWAFHVKAEAVAGVEFDAPGEAGKELAVAVLGVGDEGGEKAGAAVGVELFGDVPPGVVGLDGAVEIDAGEAVDLDVDEAGGDPGEIEEVFVGRGDFFEDVIFDLDVADLAGECSGGDFHASTLWDSRVKRISRLQSTAPISRTTGRMRTPF